MWNTTAFQAFNASKIHTAARVPPTSSRWATSSWILARSVVIRAASASEDLTTLRSMEGSARCRITRSRIAPRGPISGRNHAMGRDLGAVTATSRPAKGRIRPPSLSPAIHVAAAGTRGGGCLSGTVQMPHSPSPK